MKNRRSRIFGFASLIVVVLAMIGVMFTTSGSLAQAPTLQSGAIATVSGTSGISAIACTGSTTCFAVGQSGGPSLDGVLVPVTNGSPGGAATVTGTGTGAVVTINNGSPGNPATVSGVNLLNSIACPASSTTCLSVGTTASNQGAVVPVTNGTPGSAITVSGTSFLGDISCPSSTSCLLVGNNGTNGVVVPFNNGSAGAPIAVAGTGSLHAIFCANATSCFTVGDNAAGNAGVVVPITNGTPGGAVTVNGVSFLAGIACPSSTSCVAAGAISSGTSATGAVVPITVNAAATATPTPSPTATATGTASPTANPTATLAATPTATPSPSLPPSCPSAPSAKATPTPTPTPTANPAPIFCLVGEPQGTVLSNAIGQLYTLAAGGASYIPVPAATALTGGVGYWALFGSPPTFGPLPPPVPPATTTIALPAGQWTMVGNPFNVPVSLSAVDRSFVPVPISLSLNGADRVLVYTATGYALVTTLAPGQGAFAFSFDGGSLVLTPNPTGG